MNTGTLFTDRRVGESIVFDGVRVTIVGMRGAKVRLRLAAEAASALSPKPASAPPVTVSAAERRGT